MLPYKVTKFGTGSRRLVPKVPLLGRMIGKGRCGVSRSPPKGEPRFPRLAPDWIESHDVGDHRIDHGQEARA